MNPVQPGHRFLPMTVMTFVAPLTLTRPVRRFGTTPVLVGAFLGMATGLIWLAQAGPGGNYLASVAAPLLPVGMGSGLGLGPLTGAAMREIRPEGLGAASGMVNAAHQPGGTLVLPC